MRELGSAPFGQTWTASWKWRRSSTGAATWRLSPTVPRDFRDWVATWRAYPLILTPVSVKPGARGERRPRRRCARSVRSSGTTSGSPRRSTCWACRLLSSHRSRGRSPRGCPDHWLALPGRPLPGRRGCDRGQGRHHRKATVGAYLIGKRRGQPSMRLFFYRVQTCRRAEYSGDRVRRPTAYVVRELYRLGVEIVATSCERLLAGAALGPGMLTPRSPLRSPYSDIQTRPYSGLSFSPGSA